MKKFIFKCLHNLTSVFVEPRIIILSRKNTVMVMNMKLLLWVASKLRKLLLLEAN